MHRMEIPSTQLMIKKIHFLPLLCALILLPEFLPAQSPPITGHVRSRDGKGAFAAVPFASLAFRNGPSTQGDENGAFVIASPSTWPATLVVNASGFMLDSLVLPEPPAAPITITLSSVQELKTAEVVERVQGTMLSTRTLQAQEAIGAKELKRAACCDLSESFETNATVDASYSDAISGTKAIRMLGLDGKYAQISVENIPFIRGLSSNYGLTLVPGPWINSINVSKGIGTAVNGPNAMTGQIDLCLLDPHEADRLFANLYVNNQGRTELNLITSQRLGKYSDNALMIQGNLMQRDMDDNRDGFRDQPLTQRINVLDRWYFNNGNRTTQLITRYVLDNRSGGHTDAHRPVEGLSSHYYKAEITNEMADVIVKNGWILPDSLKSIGILAAFRNHTVSSTFGERGYEALQRSVYANVVYQQMLKSTNDQVKAGLSFQYDEFDELYLDSAFARTEQMPGAFAEYTRTRGGFTLVAGARADVNSAFGNAVSPRLHMKYDIGPLTVVRVSAGSAFRSANPIAENASALASSRNVVVEGPLGMERSWNMGASLLHKFKWMGRKWAVGVDAYRSEFVDQVVSDLDRSPRTLAIYMLDGPSYANSVLGDVQVALTRTLDAKVSYRWYDVRTTYDGVMRERPFVPTHRGMADLAYHSRSEKIRFDITCNLFGTARLPDTSTNPEPYRRAERSPAYATLNAQLTYAPGAVEFYIGGENLTSTVQQDQIIAPHDPYGTYFDAAMIWGPTSPAMIYGGIRYSLKKKEPSKEK
jgi:outer membrane receptor for ferrienterochelin and colicins